MAEREIMNNRRDGRPTDRRPSYRWRAYLPLALIAFIGISISLAAFVIVQSRENARVQAELERRADGHAKSLQRGIGNALEVLHSIRALFTASQDDEVNPAEFRAFAEQALRRHPSIQALEWIPRVPARERAAFEEALRQDGFPDFQFTEMLAEGKFVAAGPRNEYFPVYYMAPHQGNERALGFDLGSNAMRLQALMRARDTGQTVASARIRLVQETGRQHGFLVFVPIYRNGLPHDTPRQRRENLAGFALGVFRIGALVEAVLQSLTAPAGYDIYLYDESAGPDKRILYFHPSRLDPQPRGPLAEEEIVAGMNLAKTIQVAGREWRMLFKPLSITVDAQKSRQAWGVLAGGLTITVILAIYLLISLRRTRETQRFANEISKSNMALESEITERKRAEETLRASEARLAGILDIAYDAVISVDQDQHIRLFNQGAEMIFGYAAEETLGRRLDMLLPARSRNVHGRHVEGFERSSEITMTMSKREEIVGLRKDGSEFPAEASVSKLRQGDETLFTVMLRDVTERKQAELALKDSEELFRTTFEQNAVGMALRDIDPRNSRWLRVNQKFCDILGYTREELLQLTSVDISVPEERHVAIEFNELLLRGDIRSYAREKRYVRKDGQIIWTSVWLSSVLDPDGHPTQIISAIQDITERKQAEAQLRQAQKMEAVGQLTGGVAHDFNNLLTVILGNLELIAERVEDSMVGRFAQSAINASNRGAELTQRLLAFSRKQTLAPEVIELDQLVSDMTDLMRRTLGETIEIEVARDDDLWQCQADPGQLESAILNLALNARDAMPQGGKLTIGTANVKLDDADVAAWNDVSPGNYVRVSVSDTGVGMSRDVIDHAFDPFFTTKDVGAGSGLGLSMVQGFISQSGGHVAIDSTEGDGTTVILYLPKSVGTCAPARPSPTAEEFLSQGEKVLVVEDNPGVRALTVNLLADLGYDTVEAADGKEAIQVLQQMPGIDLLFTDVGLPGGMSGIDIAREAIRIIPGIKILFTSGYDDDVLSRHGGIDENLELVRKPFRKREVAQKLRSAIGQSLN